MSLVLQKWGNSQGIRIPKIIIEALNWKENETLEIKTENGKLIIEPEKKRKNIKELFADYNEEFVPENIDWGNPVGNELW